MREKNISTGEDRQNKKQQIERKRERCNNRKLGNRKIHENKKEYIKCES